MQRSPRSHRKMARAVLETLEGRRLLSGAVVGLTLDNALVSFDSRAPEKVSAKKAIGGLSAGDRVVGIDYRPANGMLYGVVDGSATDRIILINPKTGASSTVFNIGPLVGAEFGVDFNPVADALRITSDADQNLRVPFGGATPGATVNDGALAYGANDFNAGANPNVVGSAYTNSFPGTTATVLYDIDSALDVVAVQNPPNAGTLMTRGPLGVDTGPLVGFDIRAADSNANFKGEAVASLTRMADGFSRLYGIDLATGGARDIGTVGNAKKGFVTLRDITLAPDTAKTNHSGNHNGHHGGHCKNWKHDDDRRERDRDQADEADRA